MKKLVIDLSRVRNDPDRTQMIDLSPEEVSDREKNRIDILAREQQIKDDKEKRKKLIDKVAKKLDMDYDDIVELFGE